MSFINTVVNYWELVATNHQLIKHDPNNAVYRFSKFDFNEALAGQNSKLSYPLLSLSSEIPQFDPISGVFYTKDDDSLNSNFSFWISVLDKISPNNPRWEEEQRIYDLTYGIISDILRMLQDKLMSKEFSCDSLKQLDFKKHPPRLMRVGPRGQGDEVFGWCFSITYDYSLGDPQSTINNWLNYAAL